MHGRAGEDRRPATATPPCSSASASKKPQRVTKAMRGHCVKARQGRRSRCCASSASRRATTRSPSATRSPSSDCSRPGDTIDVTGVTKGRGYHRRRSSGTASAAFPASHGTHEYFRHGGSIGNRSYPGPRVQGQAHGRPLRQRARDHAEPRGRRGAPGRAPRPGARRGARRAQRHRRCSQPRRCKAKKQPVAEPDDSCRSSSQTQASRPATSTLPGGDRSAAPSREHLLYEVVNMQRANRRAGTARHQDARRSSAAAARSRGGRRAPAAPAPAARARRSGRGGAIIFGPQPRDYSYRLPRSRARRRAALGAGGDSCARASCMVVDKIELADAEDQAAGRSCWQALGVRAARSIVVDGRRSDAVERAARNLPHVKVLRAEGAQRLRHPAPRPAGRDARRRSDALRRRVARMKDRMRRHRPRR